MTMRAGPARRGPSCAIEGLTGADWDAVRDIHVAGIATGHATFETGPSSWAVFDAGKLAAHRFVARGLDDADPAETNDRDADDGARAAHRPCDRTILGWTAVTAVSDRCAYEGVVEHSIYVARAARGRGVGGRLLHTLIASTEAAGIWTIQSGIFPENAPSLALHRGAGFRVVGTRERVAKMSYGPLAGQWRDVVLLERRSPVVT